MLDSTPRVSDWVQLVRSEFIEMPGLRLTKPQAQRLWGFDPVICEGVLEALVDAEFLRRTRDGFFFRAGNETALGPQRSASVGRTSSPFVSKVPEVRGMPGNPEP